MVYEPDTRTARVLRRCNQFQIRRFKRSLQLLLARTFERLEYQTMIQLRRGISRACLTFSDFR